MRWFLWLECSCSPCWLSSVSMDGYQVYEWWMCKVCYNEKHLVCHYVEKANSPTRHGYCTNEECKRSFWRKHTRWGKTSDLDVLMPGWKPLTQHPLRLAIKDIVKEPAPAAPDQPAASGALFGGNVPIGALTKKLLAPAPKFKARSASSTEDWKWKGSVGGNTDNTFPDWWLDSTGDSKDNTAGDKNQKDDAAEAAGETSKGDAAAATNPKADRYKYVLSQKSKDLAAVAKSSIFATPKVATQKCTTDSEWPDDHAADDTATAAESIAETQPQRSPPQTEDVEEPMDGELRKKKKRGHSRKPSQAHKQTKKQKVDAAEQATITIDSHSGEEAAPSKKQKHRGKSARASRPAK